MNLLAPVLTVVILALLLCPGETQSDGNLPYRSDIQPPSKGHPKAQTTCNEPATNLQPGAVTDADNRGQLLTIGDNHVADAGRIGTQTSCKRFDAGRTEATARLPGPVLPP